MALLLAPRCLLRFIYSTASHYHRDYDNVNILNEFVTLLIVFTAEINERCLRTHARSVRSFVCLINVRLNLAHSVY